MNEKFAAFYRSFEALICQDTIAYTAVPLPSSHNDATCLLATIPSPKHNLCPSSTLTRPSLHVNI
jgi:hypothetical protein